MSTPQARRSPLEQTNGLPREALDPSLELTEQRRRISAIVGERYAPSLAVLSTWHLQRQLAQTGQAVNQCPGCGSYRMDTLPPTLHERDCPAWRPELAVFKP